MEIKQLPLVYQTGNAKKISIGSACIIIELDKVLLVRSQDSQNWKFPGGHANDQESIRQTADREAEEELGCQIELFGQPFFYIYQPTADHDIILIHYQARIASGKPQANGEINELGWYSPHDLPADCYPNIKPTLQHFTPA